MQKKTRGPNKQKPWERRPEDGVSVIRLALDTRDVQQRALLEGIFDGAFQIRRAVQRDAVARLDAYWAARHERARGAHSVRARMGLSRTDFEHAAYSHLDAAPHLRRFVTKALAMHLADSAWTPTERHLFRDATGKRFGAPGVSRWFEFTRLPGRARSHTRPRKWETFRLHGTLAGHRAAYVGSDGSFVQPRRMRQIERPDGSWWEHDGPLVLVFSGLPAGELALPVRLPAAPSNQAILDHHLGDPSRWHKVDLVRRRDPNAEGGWRYEAHLMVLVEPYVSPATAARREAAARASIGRVMGIDVNVSNVSVASHVAGADIAVTRIERSAGEKESLRKRDRRERLRGRALDRSRRAANPHQYDLSRRQLERAKLRAAQGLPPTQVIPKGPRKSRSNGKPQQAYRRDALSRRYKRERACQEADHAAAKQARKAAARAAAGRLVLQHGFRGFVEDCNLSAWSRLWGRSMSAFSPGTLLSAIEREATAVARIAESWGGIQRIPTSTALSQHCLCGARVEKSLAERVHECVACGLAGDRDAVSALLAGFCSEADPKNLHVDFAAARASLPEARRVLERITSNGRQDARTESTVHSGHDGSRVAETGPTSAMAARRIVGTNWHATPDETGSRSRTKSERVRRTAGMSQWGDIKLPPLRDNS